jgi:hypothetical protein
MTDLRTISTQVPRQASTLLLLCLHCLIFSLIIHSLSDRFRMYFTKTTIISFGLLASSQLVAGHAAITGATGDQGGAGSAIGGKIPINRIESSV